MDTSQSNELLPLVDAIELLWKGRLGATPAPKLPVKDSSVNDTANRMQSLCVRMEEWIICLEKRIVELEKRRVRRDRKRNPDDTQPA